MDVRVGAPPPTPIAVEMDSAGIPRGMGEAVELWAREHGTHGKLGFQATMQTWVVEFDLKPDDPRMKAWKEGRWPTAKQPKEQVFLHRQEGAGGHYKPVKLEDLGVEGIRAWLDRGNLWSGRGVHDGLDKACEAADRHNRELEETIERVARENARLRVKEHHRDLFDLPLVSVPDNLEK